MLKKILLCYEFGMSMSDILEYDGTMIDCFITVKEEKLYQIWLQDNISVNKSIAAK